MTSRLLTTPKSRGWKCRDIQTYSSPAYHSSWCGINLTRVAGAPLICLQEYLQFPWLLPSSPATSALPPPSPAPPMCCLAQTCVSFTTPSVGLSNYLTWRRTQGLLVCEHTTPSTGQNTKKHTCLGKNHRILHQEYLIQGPHFVHERAELADRPWVNRIIKGTGDRTLCPSASCVWYHHHAELLASFRSTTHKRIMQLSSWELLGSKLKHSPRHSHLWRRRVLAERASDR